MSEDMFDLARDITRALDEYVFDVNGDGVRRFRSRTDAEIYDVDQDVIEGPVVLVRRSDEARFLVDVHVTVTPEAYD